MASSGFAADPFERNQVSLLVSADDTWRFFEDHGFFYQENTEIGRRVDELYNTCDFRNPEVKLNYTPVLGEDSVSRLKTPLRTDTYQSSVSRASSTDTQPSYLSGFHGAQLQRASTTGSRRKIQEQTMT